MPRCMGRCHQPIVSETRRMRGPRLDRGPPFQLRNQPFHASLFPATSAIITTVSVPEQRTTFFLSRLCSDRLPFHVVSVGVVGTFVEIYVVILLPPSLPLALLGLTDTPALRRCHERCLFLVEMSPPRGRYARSPLSSWGSCCVY